MRVGHVARCWLTVAVATGVFGMAPAEAAAVAPVTLAQAAPVYECDRLAAGDTDRHAAAEGVATWRLSGRGPRVVAACQQAIAAYPEEPRFHYQLARGLVEVRAPAAEVIAALQQAVDLDPLYVAAMTWLGHWYDNKYSAPAFYDQRHASTLYGRAFEAVKPRAAQGEPEALYWACNLYRTPLAAEYDVERGVALCRQAAERGYVPAYASLAWALSDDNTNEAIDWLLKATDAGDLDAAHDLGGWARDGDYGIEPRKDMAAKLFRLAADGGHSRATSDLGQMYEEGDGVPIDFAEAARLYARCARLEGTDDHGCIFRLARLYDGGGPGLGQDYGRAAQLYRACAVLEENDNADYDMCHSSLDRMYEDGHAFPETAAAEGLDPLPGATPPPGIPVADRARGGAPRSDTRGLDSLRVEVLPSSVQRGDSVALTLRFRLAGVDGETFKVLERWTLSTGGEALPSYPVEREETLRSGEHESTYRQTIPAGASAGTYLLRGEVCVAEDCFSRTVMLEVTGGPPDTDGVR